MIRTWTGQVSKQHRWWGLATLMALAILAAAPPAKAGLIGNFSGDTHPQLSPQPGVDSTISFAIFDRAGGSAGDSFGIGLAGIDSVLSSAGFIIGNAAASPYLWLYQVANGPDSGTTDVSVLVGAPGSIVTSVGILPTQYSFNDDGGPLSFANPFGAGAAPGNPSGVSTNPLAGGPWIVDGQANAAQPTTLSLFPSALQALFASPGLTPGQVSSIFGFSSTAAPTEFALAHVAGATGASGTSADGMTPTAVVPEPSTLGLVASALLLGTWPLRRLRNRDAN